MISLSDRQLSILLEAAKPLPVEKRGIFLQRVEAMLRHRRRRHGLVADDDVADCAGLARCGLVQQHHPDAA